MKQYSLTYRRILQNKELTKAEKQVAIKDRTRRIFLGSKNKDGILLQIVVYTLLICIGFVYLYPLLYMAVTSFMSLEDLLDAAVRWIPTKLYLKNYKDAYYALKFKTTLWNSFYVSLIPTICQVVICASVGYGFARYDFRGKKILMALMIFTFIIPPQILMMPTYVLYTDMKLIGSMKAFVLPAVLGQGFKSAIFILIYYQFFKQIPKSLIEAAYIDGAGHFRSFFRIAIPSAIPAIIVVFLFSFVWYWNETYLVTLYLGGPNRGTSGISTILIELQNFQSNYEQLYPVTANTPDRINEAIRMAGTMISIAPLLMIYFSLQNYFVESVDRTGITGE